MRVKTATRIKTITRVKMATRVKMSTRVQTSRTLKLTSDPHALFPSVLTASIHNACLPVLFSNAHVLRHLRTYVSTPHLHTYTSNQQLSFRIETYTFAQTLTHNLINKVLSDRAGCASLPNTMYRIAYRERQAVNYCPQNARANDTP